MRHNRNNNRDKSDDTKVPTPNLHVRNKNPNM